VLARYGEALMRIYQRRGPVAAGMTRVKGWLSTNPSSTELERLYSRKAVYDWSKAARLLGYRPAFDLEHGMRFSVEWLRYAGLLN
jgi:nucleoside-diphosphate-sugar epimerase